MSGQKISIGTSVAIKFLRDFAEFGSQGHLVTANALEEAIKVSSKQPTKKILTARIFSLLMTAVEDLAAICISVKHREDGLGLVYNYLTYGTNKRYSPNTNLGSFYREIKNGIDFFEYLDLPEAREIHQAGYTLDNVFVDEINSQLVARGKVGAKENYSSREYLLDLYEEIPLIMRSAAQMYLVDDKGLVRTFNKTKHGFFVIEDSHIFQNEPRLISHDSCWVVLGNPNYKPDSDRSESVVELSRIDISDTHKMKNNIYTLAQAVRAICLLTASLLEVELVTSADDKA